MKKEKYSICFACYNAVDYTKKCIDSLITHNTPLDRLVIVDNASTDGTSEFLEKTHIINIKTNKKNLGCGTAWNQAALTLQSEWTIIMNNDVIVSHDWIKRLINSAEKHNLKVISPALIEGDLNYDLDALAEKNSELMSDVIRLGHCHAVCMAVHETVWEKTGYFQANPRLLGFEDTLFFDALRQQKIRTGMTGAAWIHHYGSITLSIIKKEQGLLERDNLSHRKNYQLLNQSWLERKSRKATRMYKSLIWRKHEMKNFNKTLHGIRKSNNWEWL
jgi:N-acetylglucosaminyl-diphospho-decaprenol L-rhamnosyltransferase